MVHRINEKYKNEREGTENEKSRTCKPWGCTHTHTHTSRLLINKKIRKIDRKDSDET